MKDKVFKSNHELIEEQIVVMREWVKNLPAKYLKEVVSIVMRENSRRIQKATPKEEKVARGLKSWDKRTEGKSKDEISEMMRSISNRKKIK